MPSTPLLLKKLRVDHPQFIFASADAFHWSPDSMTIFVDTSSPDFAPLALHELGHALLGHREYSRDIDLIKCERDAWSYAITHLSVIYAVTINSDHAQDNLDTYRDWLHARSQCPSCESTGLQIGGSLYSCLACGCRWKSNDARTCALRRYSTRQP